MEADKHGVPEQQEQELFMDIAPQIWQPMVIYIIGIQLLNQKDFVQVVGMYLVMQSGQP